MKKLKIIEKSRFLREESDELTHDEMNRVYGGSGTLCSSRPGDSYYSCRFTTYESCIKAPSLAGFSHGSCDGGAYILCGSDMSYHRGDLCNQPAIYSTSCGSGKDFEIKF